jgi:hypothetical protein
VPDLVVDIAGSGEGDADGRLAEVLRFAQPARWLRAVQAQAQVDAGLRSRFQHGEGAAGRDQRDERAARLDGDRPRQCGEGAEHCVEDRP